MSKDKCVVGPLNHDVFRALGNKTRLGIVKMLIPGNRSVKEICETMGISQPLASQHLSKLSAAGVVVSDRVGQESRYGLSPRVPVARLLAVLNGR